MDSLTLGISIQFFIHTIQDIYISVHSRKIVIFEICIFRGSRLQMKTGMQLERIKFGFVKVAGKGYFVLNKFT